MMRIMLCLITAVALSNAFGCGGLDVDCTDEGCVEQVTYHRHGPDQRRTGHLVADGAGCRGQLGEHCESRAAHARQDASAHRPVDGAALAAYPPQTGLRRRRQ